MLRCASVLVIRWVNLVTIDRIFVMIMIKTIENKLHRFNIIFTFGGTSEIQIEKSVIIEAIWKEFVWFFVFGQRYCYPRAWRQRHR